MTRPWHIIVLLAAAALAVSAWGWHARKNAWQPPPARLPQLPSLPALPTPEAADMHSSLARPVLWPARRPPEQGSRKSEDPELAKARLLAVVSSGKDLIALLARPDGSALRLTSSSQPWRVQAFDGRTATLVHSGNGQRVERVLERQAQPSPAAPAAKAAPKPANAAGKP